MPAIDGMVFEELSDEELLDYCRSNKSQGAYDRYLELFLASGMKGVRVDLTQGIMFGTTPRNAYTGFLRRIKAGLLPGVEHVEVSMPNGHVILIRRDLVKKND